MWFSIKRCVFWQHVKHGYATVYRCIWLICNTLHEVNSSEVSINPSQHVNVHWSLFNLELGLGCPWILLKSIATSLYWKMLSTSYCSSTSPYHPPTHPLAIAVHHNAALDTPTKVSWTPANTHWLPVVSLTSLEYNELCKRSSYVVAIKYLGGWKLWWLQLELKPGQHYWPDDQLTWM